MKRSIFAFVLIGGLLLCPGLAADELDGASGRLAALVSEVKADYPAVPHVSVAALQANRANTLLVDVRELDEFSRSHLPGAVHAPSPEAIDALWRAHPDKTLVVYCTVGVRSAIAAKAFMTRHPQAQPLVNLEGSIFAWANAGGALENASGPTTDVHPYSAWWGFRYLEDAASRAGASRRALEAPAATGSVNTETGSATDRRTPR